jgi:6-phosphogluconolactonase (cycloisomerase 2 family)
MKAATVFLHRLTLGAMATWLFLFSLGGSAVAKDQEEAQAQSGRAYVMSNAAAGNTVIVFNRANDGSLIRIQEVATGGFGSGPGILPPPLPPFPGPIPLDSQDALIITQDGRFLLAVNPDSNDLSALAVTRQGVRLVSRVSSGGSFPVSVTEHDGIVYVANAGQSPDEFIGARPSIAGFRLDQSGHLHPIRDSRRVAGGPDASAADLVFSPDGRHLVMTELNGNNIDAFPVNEDGRAGERTTQPANNLTPFGAEFSRNGTLTVAETDDISRRFAINNGASVSTYRFTDDGTLQPISKAVPNGQTASCWNRLTPDGHILFTINAGSGTISIYRISDSGEATLQTAVTADTGGAFSLPIDSSVSPDGKFLYVLAALDGLNGHPVLPLPPTVATIQIYSIGSGGSLTRVGTVPGIPFTVEGIVVR